MGKVVGGVLLFGVLLFGTLASIGMIHNRNVIIDNLHELYPCKDTVADTTIGPGNQFGIVFTCKDDRAVAQYSCGDGKCLYGCSCWPWKAEQARKAKEKTGE